MRASTLGRLGLKTALAIEHTLHTIILAVSNGSAAVGDDAEAQPVAVW